MKSSKSLVAVATLLLVGIVLNADAGRIDLPDWKRAGETSTHFLRALRDNSDSEPEPLILLARRAVAEQQHFLRALRRASSSSSLEDARDAMEKRDHTHFLRAL